MGFMVLEDFVLLKKVILEQDNKCLNCGNDMWNGIEILLELHHKDGNPFNNKRENLEALCLNCHAQTSNYRNKSRK